MDKINVIIADDNENFLEGLKLMLSINKKFNIIDSCKNGKMLVESAEKLKADLILTDIDMPEMDGIQAAKIINFSQPDVCMIALTMFIDKVFLVDIINAGFKGFVYKPDTAKNLMETIDMVLDNKFVFPNELKLK